MRRILQSTLSNTNKVIEIYQYGVAYCTKSNPVISGVLTRNLIVCLGLVFETKQEFVVMHIDTNVDTDSIAEQLKIIKTAYTLTIVSNQLNLEKVMKSYPESFRVHKFLERLETSLKKKNISKWKKISQKNTFTGCFFVLMDGSIVTDKLLTTEKPPFYDFRTTLNFINYLSACEGTDFAKLKLDLQYNFNIWSELPSLTITGKKLVDLYKKTLNWDKFILLSESEEIFKGLVILLKEQPMIESRFREYIQQEELTLKNVIYPLDSKKPFCDNFLIERLNQLQSNYNFFSVRDEAYKVDAVTFFNPESEKQVSELKLLQSGINNLGIFYKTEKGQDIFVIEAVNLPSNESIVQETVGEYLKKLHSSF